MISQYWGLKAGGFYSPKKDKHGNVEGFIVKGKRKHATMKGTRHFPIAAVGSAGGHGSFRTTIWAKLASNALSLGWLNGVRIRPGK